MWEAKQYLDGLALGQQPNSPLVVAELPVLFLTSSSLDLCSGLLNDILPQPTCALNYHPILDAPLLCVLPCFSSIISLRPLSLVSLSGGTRTVDVSRL